MHPGRIITHWTYALSTIVRQIKCFWYVLPDYYQIGYQYDKAQDWHQGLCLAQRSLKFLDYFNLISNQHGRSWKPTKAQAHGT